MVSQNIPRKNSEGAQSLRSSPGEGAVRVSSLPAVQPVPEPTLQSIAEGLGYDYIEKLMPEKLDPGVVKMIPEKEVREREVIAIKYDPDREQLMMATHDPNDLSRTDELLQIIDCQAKAIVIVVASREDILTCIEHFYSHEDARVEVIQQANLHSPPLETRNGEVVVPERDQPNEPWPKRILGVILQEALNGRASDISIQPQSMVLVVRLKIDGQWRRLAPPPDLSWEKQVVSLIKVAAEMDFTEVRKPLDGKLTARYKKQRYDLRIAIVPVVAGEMVTIRILDPKNANRTPADIGFCPSDIELVKDLTQRENGIVLVTGPTGSGKTSTLYCALQQVDRDARNILTIEDPVEYLIEGFNQISVNEAVGRNFASILRACLRHAPDVILVGEMRDPETVETAFKAALTGHLVFSTLHTNDALSTIIRLMDMGVPRYMIAEVLRSVIAQRLVRLLCCKCSKPFVPDHLRGLRRPIGCGSCNGGYSGRTAIHEILVCQGEVREGIRGGPIEGLRILAVKNGMKTLRQRGLDLVFTGKTTLEEVCRATTA